MCWDTRNVNIPLKRKSTDVHSDAGNYGSVLLELCRNFTFCILNGRCGDDKHIGKATTVEESVIDYMIGSPFILSKVSGFYVYEFDPLFSDKHCMLGVLLNVNLVNDDTGTQSLTVDQLSPTVVNCEKEVSIGKWDKNNADEFIRNIQLVKVDKLLHDLDDLTVDEITRELCNIMINSAVVVFPKKLAKTRNVQKTSNNAPWFNRACRLKKQEYLKAKKMHKAHVSQCSRESVRSKSREYKKEIYKAQRAYRKKCNRELVSMKSNNPKLFWEILNCPNRNNESCPVSLEIFHEHFKRLSDWEVQIDKIPENTCTECTHGSNDLNSMFTEQEIKQVILKLKPGKSAGIDQILNEYIKSTVNVFMPVYVSLFNKIFESGIFLEDWTLGMIIPIFKRKGDAVDPDNYRGITLLSCLGKLFTNVLNARLLKFCEDNSILRETQAGFRKSYSTTDHIFLLKHVIDLFCFKKRRLFCSFIDYSKAFDSVWRDALWYKLLKVGVKGKFLDVVVNMYRNIKSCVFVNEMKSEFFVSLKSFPIAFCIIY